MIGSSYLKARSLFVALPQTSVTATDSFYHQDYVESAPYGDLVDITHQLITGATIEQENELLALWEIRLTLLLFDGRLSTAKQEAVNLNDALFFHENPTSTSGRNGPMLTQPAPAANYPLPKNNAGIISHLLLMLVLRLKSNPNLALVNELYKLCYQIRLKGVTAEAQTVQMKLFNLSYEIISVLVISRHYLTLLSFLQSLKRDTHLCHQYHGDNEQHYGRFLSNISLIWIYNVLINRRSKKTGEKLSVYAMQYQQEWSSIAKSTKETLIEALKRFTTSNNDALLNLDPESFLITQFAALVESDTISARIISCTLATWDLENKPFTDSNSIRGETAQDEQEANSLAKTYSIIMAKWTQYPDKVYGME